MGDFQQNYLNALQGGLQIGNQLKQVRNQNQLSRLAGQAYSAAPEQRQAIIGEAVSVDPDAGFGLEQNLDQSEDRRTKVMVNMAKMLTSAPEQARPALYSRMYPSLQQFGMSDLPATYDQATGPVIMGAASSIVKALGTPDAAGKVFAQKIDSDGNIWNTMADGSMVNTGVKADRQMWFRDVPGVDPGLVDKTGSVTPLSNASQPQPAPAAVEIGGDGAGALRMDIEGIDPVRQQRLAQTVSMMQQANYPEEEIESFLQMQMSAPQQVGTPPPAQTPMAAPPTGPAAARPATSPAEAERLRLAQEEADRKKWGTAPTGQRFRPDGTLEDIPGARIPPTGADKPIPVPALKELLAVEDSLAVAESVFRTAQKHTQRIADGSLKINPAMGWMARGRTAIGNANANDVNYNELVADRTKLVNDSLLLNKGVQTEGDAQRAAAALMNSQDEASTIRAFKRLVEINKQGMELQQRKAELIRANYGQGRNQSQRSAPSPADDGVDDLLLKYGAQ